MIRWKYGGRLSKCGTFEVRKVGRYGTLFEVVTACGEVELVIGKTYGGWADAHVLAEQWLRMLVAQTVCERGE